MARCCRRRQHQCVAAITHTAATMLFTTFTTTIHTLPTPTCEDGWPCPRLTRSPLDFIVRLSSTTHPGLARDWEFVSQVCLTVGYLDVRAVLVAGAGFFIDSYDIFAINLIVSLLGLVFYSGDTSINGYGGNGGILPGPVNQALKASTSGGIVLGMFFFGWLAE